MADARQTISELAGLAAGSCRIYGEAHPYIFWGSVAGSLVVAGGFWFLCVIWARGFNKAYRLSGALAVAVAAAAVLGATLLPVGIALGSAGESATASIKQSLAALSQDPVAVAEMKRRTHDSMATSAQAQKMQDPEELAPDQHWEFLGKPKDESILLVARSYLESVSDALARRNTLLAPLLAWDMAPGLLAADIRSQAAQNPQHAYNLDPGQDALADIITAELAARVDGLVFMLRLSAAAIATAVAVILLSLIARSAYSDIRVHWPREL